MTVCRAVFKNPTVISISFAGILILIKVLKCYLLIDLVYVDTFKFCKGQIAGLVKELIKYNSILANEMLIDMKAILFSYKISTG